MRADPEAGSGMQFDQVEAPAPSGPPACAPITGPFRFGGALSVPAPVPVTAGPPPAAGT